MTKEEKVMKALTDLGYTRKESGDSETQLQAFTLQLPGATVTVQTSTHMMFITVAPGLDVHALVYPRLLGKLLPTRMWVRNSVIDAVINSMDNAS